MFHSLEHCGHENEGLLNKATLQPRNSPLVTLGRGIHTEKAKGSHIFSQVTLLLPTSLRCFREIMRKVDGRKRQRQEGGERWRGKKDGVEKEKKGKKGGRREESWRGARRWRLFSPNAIN